MDDDTIMSPRFLDNKDICKQYNELLKFGNSKGGIKVWITRKGIYVNGYYRGLREEVKYRNMKDMALIPWKEIDVLRNKVMEAKRKRKKKDD